MHRHITRFAVILGVWGFLPWAGAQPGPVDGNDSITVPEDPEPDRPEPWVRVGAPPGFEIIQITDDLAPEDLSKLNDCAEIVYSKHLDVPDESEEIFLYDNGRTTRLTNDDVRDAFPDINNEGTIVWTRGADGFGGGTVTVYHDGTITELVAGYHAVINNVGHLAWIRFNGEGCYEADADIFLYDGNTVRQITLNDLSNQSVKINDLDELAWTRYDFCPGLVWWESDIMLYSEGLPGSPVPLTDAQFQVQSPTINNLGQVAWDLNDEQLQSFIEIWEDGATAMVTDWGSNAKLNNLGHIGFSRWDESLQMGYAFLYREGVFFQLSDGSVITGLQDINEYDEVVLSLNYGFPHTDVAFMRRIRTGDVDFDFDVDAEDFAELPTCITGPFDTDRLCECRFLDLDHDRDVDLADFAIFQNNFTGE